MSKRQEKIERARQAQENYLIGQSAYQGLRILIQLQQGYETGLHLYESQKETLSEEEITQIEGMKKEQEEALIKLKEQLGLPADWHYSMLNDEPLNTPAEA